MFWLGTPPWGRWLAAIALVATAFWFEVRPTAEVQHPFAVVDVFRGDLIGPDNTTLRKIPAGLFEPVALGVRATRDIAAGVPVLAADVSASGDRVPPGWWSLPTDLPSGAQTGDPVMVVLLDTGEAVEGVVVSAPGTDPFGDSRGTVALPPDRAVRVAAAAADGRVAILVGVD